ncbi:MAG: putative NADP-specific glutamate dehydrogenase [Streblomastix strix]|uniref:Putative NADP-specific glutamate dehydrogenase n=1 Tax=Streblomastix strix TaxID=222440 RepID=A0A5J4VZX7_9EUKA|nr:MAG: putative NADP-specific glutamate dehydrogenase [Streblomastix strix]
MFANQKAIALGGKEVAMSDSNEYINDSKGINLDIIKKIKIAECRRIKDYASQVLGTKYEDGCSKIWNDKCDIALPCATQNELYDEFCQIIN